MGMTRNRIISQDDGQGVVTPRKLNVAFPDSIPRYWFDGSPFLTHLLNVYTLLIPDNESYYIRQLKRCLKDIEDPHLKTQLLNFFRQEGQHGIEHRAFWSNLERQGLRYEGFTRAVNFLIYRILEPILPRPVHLANVACIEHINAYLGHFYLSRGRLQGADEHMRLLFEWHFAEEIEHKAVAFDVFQTVSGSYPVRLFSAVLVFPLFYLINTVGLLYLLSRDGRLLERRTWRDFSRHLFTDGALMHDLRNIGRYLKPAFHPWQLRDYDLAREFLDRAAGEGYVWPVTRPG